MNTAAVLLALYPPPVREQWGDDLAREVAAGGWRSWPDTVGGAARLWVRPGDWPEHAAGQTRRIILGELAAAATLVALLLRAAGRPTALFTASLAYPATSAWAAVIIAGLLLAAPLPPPRWGAILRLPAACLRTLVPPAAAFTAMYVLAQSSFSDHPAIIGRYLMPCCYWAMLAFAGLQWCRLANQVFAVLVPPSARRLRAATLTVGTGLAMAAAQNLASATASPGAGALSVGLGGLAIAVLATGLDLRRVAPSSRGS